MSVKKAPYLTFMCRVMFLCSFVYNSAYYATPIPFMTALVYDIQLHHNDVMTNNICLPLINNRRAVSTRPPLAKRFSVLSAWAYFKVVNSGIKLTRPWRPVKTNITVKQSRSFVARAPPAHTPPSPLAPAPPLALRPTLCVC